VALARCFNGLKLRLWTHHELTWVASGRRTLAAAGTSQTILFAKLDANHLWDSAILFERPLAADVALLAGGLLGLPVNGETSVIKALTGTGAALWGYW
jgi:hypothetical protein